MWNDSDFIFIFDQYILIFLFDDLWFFRILNLTSQFLWFLDLFSNLRRIFRHFCIFNFCGLSWGFSLNLWLLLNRLILVSFFVFTSLVLSFLSFFSSFNYRHWGSCFFFVFLSNFLKLCFNTFLKRIFFIILIKINHLLFLDYFWLRIRFLSCISCCCWVHIWSSINIFESYSLQNRFNTSYFRRYLFTFLLYFFDHFKNFYLELFLLWWVTKKERSFLWKSSVFLTLIIVGLQHVLLHSIHHKLIKHFREVWLLASRAASSRHTSVLNIVVSNILTFVSFKSTLLNIIWSFGTHHVSIHFFVVQLLWTYSIRQINFLYLIGRLLFGNVVCLTQFFDLFYSLNDFGLYLHKYNLLTIGCQSIILFAQL